MIRATRRFHAALIVAAMSSACGGGGGTPPVTVSSVAITAPATAPAFARLGRTVQFSAQARDAAGAAIGGAAIAWSSSNPAVATVSGSGLVTATGDGTTQISASSGGQASPNVPVTVQQVPFRLTISPAPLTFGALGSTRQMTATLNDSGLSPLASTPAPTWSISNRGTATISATGLVTSVALTPPGQSDSLRADVTVGGTGFTAAMAVIVNQVAATVTVTSPSGGPDTLFATGRTRQFTPVVSDSNGNAMSSTGVTWSTSAGSVATVSGSGLVTAVADGVASIQATAGGKSGARLVLVRRLAATHSISPSSATISTNLGTQVFTGAAADSGGTSLPLIWVSRNSGVVGMNPGTGASSTATATGFNGSTNVVILVAAGPVDSAAVTTTNQTAPPASFAANVQPIFSSSCAKVGCHTGAFPSGGMNLSTGSAYTNIVGVTANSVPSLKRVLPGNPNDSYIVIKVEGNDPRLQGSRMPDDAPTGQPFLTPAQVQVIRSWILQGAPNN